MESRLNAQNQGLTFDAQKSIDWIKTLKRTKVFDEGFQLRRAGAIEKIQRRVNQELRTITDVNASTGVVSLTVLEFSFSETNPEVRKVLETVTFSLVSSLPNKKFESRFRQKL